ncbi:DUF3710 domain-containing protein [Corynebacterium cystitidis]|uniref:DUF3710 domain-containing protein n=1 Tax=Corynebacterium cystitidis TaxID=35757 RepID=UPI00211DB2DB|nr:DUF3710 domain-containing protein [Corynebacterium cystitidis]
MALWPFGKNSKHRQENEELQGQEWQSVGPESVEPAESAQAEVSGESADTELPLASGATGIVEHDPVSGDVGPFDGDSVEINDFDFSDFGVSILNLGSMRIPLPQESQVQVEMGDQSPRMLHIVTHHGRITPVAFAAPSSGGQWDQSVDEIADGMRGQGMPVTLEIGPWGREVVGTGTNGVIRIFGVDGPRWMLRMTCAAPTGKEEQLAALAREMAARTFVYRGNDPILAGNSLPVILPQQLAEQVQQAVQQRAQQQMAQQGQTHEDMRRSTNNQQQNGNQQ